MPNHLLFIQVLAVVAICARQQNDEPFNDKAYRDIPWGEDGEHGFFPREPAAFPGHNAVPPSLTTDSLVPTRTHPRGLVHRGFDSQGCNLETNNCFTFLCPTSIQCADGGCCDLGKYCGIKGGILGCCPLTGPQCDTTPIPGCSVSCYGVCCDFVQDILGAPICSPTIGSEGQSSGLCTGAPVTETVLAPSATSCPGKYFLCGTDCCPSDAGLVCDNTTIPDEPFCNLPS